MRASLNSYFLFLYVFSLPLMAKPFDTKMQSILSLGGRKDVDVSAEFQQLSRSKTLFQWNAEKVLTPASTTKILTSVALLSKLDPEFRMETRVYRTGVFENGTLNGDLLFVGDGDPLLVSEELFILVSQLHSKGYREIKGDLLLDNSLFPEEADPSGQNKRYACSMRAYDAPVSALGVNFNTISIAVHPAKKIGEKARAQLEPFSIDGIKIISDVKTVAKGRDSITFDCRRQQNGDMELRLEGKVVQSEETLHVYRALPNHQWLTGKYILSFLKHFGIQVRGKVRPYKKKGKETLILTHKSKRLADMVESLGIYSNNYVGDVLLKRMAYALGRKNTYEGSLNFLTDYLRSIGLKGRMIIKDGSGLNHENRLSAHHLNAALSHAFHNFRIFPEFLTSLPRAGLGTLKKRFRDPAFEKIRKNLRAKTGTLTVPVSVSTFAGYFDHPDLGLVSFAILQNGKKGSKQPSLLDLQDSQEKAIAHFIRYFKRT